MNSANFLSGGLYGTLGSWKEYFNLRTYNDQLLEENARLRELLLTKDPRFSTLEENSNFTKIIDSLYHQIDTLQQDYKLIPAKVYNNNYAKLDNFITIKGGIKDSIKPDMAVITSQGIVGTIDRCSSGYSTVISVLNSNFSTSAQLKNSQHYGTISWLGKNPKNVLLSDIPSQANIALKDTIITSGRSAIFPKGIPIGTIVDFQLDKSQNYFNITLQLFNDMTNIGHVYVINSIDKAEIKALESELNE